MRIGELAERTATSARSLRHYEAQGLFTAARTEAGYRVYGPAAIHTVARIRWLLQAGFSTRQIKAILPCVTDSAPHAITCDRVRAEFKQELERLAQYKRALMESERLIRSALRVNQLET